MQYRFFVIPLVVCQAAASMLPTSFKQTLRMGKADPYYNWTHERNEIMASKTHWMKILKSIVIDGEMGHAFGEPGTTELFNDFGSRLRMFNVKAIAGPLVDRINAMNGPYGFIAAPPGSAPRRVAMDTPSPMTGRNRVKIRYGPYSVPSMKYKNKYGISGMLNNFAHVEMERPCEGDCTLIGMRAGLEYLDGTEANTDTGMWLHHLVLFNEGAGREDVTCGDRPFSITHASVGLDPRSSERMFGSGNERTEASFMKWGIDDAGYILNPKDKFVGSVELMNNNMDDKNVWMTITWDYIDGHPFEDDIKMIWLDVDQCGSSQVNPPKDYPKFTIEHNWKATFDGLIIGSIEHLHDGGSRMTLSIDNEVVCDSSTNYGTTERYIGQNHDDPDLSKYISHIDSCFETKSTRKALRKDQIWNLRAYYDFDQHQGRKHVDGNWDEIMGVALAYSKRTNGSQILRDALRKTIVVGNEC